MTSKNGCDSLISLLQYFKNTDINNPDIPFKDPRIVEIDRIVSEVLESEEWEDVRMNILEYGIEHGKKLGLSEGKELGLSEGKELGLSEGMSIVNTLNKKLTEDNRLDDLVKSATDKDFQNQLLKEYNLL